VIRKACGNSWAAMVNSVRQIHNVSIFVLFSIRFFSVQIITADKQAAATTNTVPSEQLLNVSSGVSKGSRRTHRHESGSSSKSGSLRHHKSASLRHHHRHHHHHHDGAAADSSASNTPATPASPASPAVAATPTITVTAARSAPLQVGFHTDIGQRESNEDAHLTELALPFDANTAIFAVFDGHGGSKASRFCEKKFVSFLEKTKAYASDKSAALTEAFIKCDKKYIERVEDDGCTALVVLLTADNHLYVAHAGDSRAILIPSAGDVIALTADHKPEQPKEKKRIEAAGHEVVRDTIVQHGKRVHTFRIDSVLSVARSIGDAEYKDSFDLSAAEQAVTCVPDVSDRKVAPGDIVVLACDGLFDVMSNELVAEKVRKYRAAGDSLDAAAKRLTESAIQELGSDDNVSVVLVEIPK
jgi:serine/threonine protein phosphatase PrpC